MEHQTENDSERPEAAGDGWASAEELRAFDQRMYDAGFRGQEWLAEFLKLLGPNAKHCLGPKKP